MTASPAQDRAALIDAPDLHGLELCRALAGATDAWLADLYRSSGAPGHGVALVAVGGYGRGELSPHSDLDLVLVHDGHGAIAAIAEAIWYPVWDAKVKLGHAVRTTKEALALAGDDLETATSLLSARTLAGDPDLGRELASRAIAQWRKKAKRFMGALGRSVEDRHAEAGEVAFLLEPDLKQGRGGLRDAHAIWWAGLAEVVELPEDDPILRRAYERLLGVRVELHRIAARPRDHLTLEDQDVLAARLGYGDADELMREVSSAARDIAWASDEVWHRIGASLVGPSIVRLRRDRDLAPGVVLRDGDVHLTAEADPAHDPALALRVAVAAAEHGTRIERASLERLAARAAPLPIPWTAELRELFVALLLAGEASIPVIDALDRKGLWVRILPEWDPVRCRPQRNAYHTFTVDRHLCQTAANAAALAEQVDRPDLLVIGALLHDIGKGRPGDHTAVGIEIVGRMGPRMGFNTADTRVLTEMVRHHLLLPDIATRRDLSDDTTIALVAEAVGDLSTLYLLSALCQADSLATGPAAWNSWKAELVSELVARTAHVLGGGAVEEVSIESFPTVAQLERMARRELIIDGAGDQLLVIAPDRPGLFSRVAGVLALHGFGVLDANAHSAEGMALEVFRVRSDLAPVIPWDGVVRDLELALQGRLALAARIEERARRYAGRRSGGSAPVVPTRVVFDNQASQSATVLEVHATDAIGLLYRVTKAMAELDLDISSAKVQTLGDEAVDAFYVRDRRGEKIVDPDHQREVERALLFALRADA